MPAYTEWISQPAISSASSTARWIDCTVDSMLTTTPFFSPREGCDADADALRSRRRRSISPTMRDHLGGADVEAHDQISVGTLKHDLCNLKPRCRRCVWRR